MIRRILLPLDPSPYTKIGTEVACTIAKRLDAEVTGLAVLDVPGIEHAVGPIPVGGAAFAKDLVDFQEKEATGVMNSLLEQFQDKVQSRNIRHEVVSHSGSPSEQIVLESMFYDLVIMGFRTYYHFETQDEEGLSLLEVLDHSVPPVLAVPNNPDLREPENVLIAFNGSLPSARALRQFAQLADLSDPLVRIVMAADADEKGKAEIYLERAAEYLAYHKFRRVETYFEAGSVIKAVQSKYLDWADLFVIGAHSRHGLLDFIVGSLGKFLIKEAKKPVLISH